MPIKQRSLPVILLLSFLTCGLYWYFFIYRTTQDVNQMAGADGKPMSPPLALLFSIFCSIYVIYWYFKMQKRLEIMAGNNNISFNKMGPLFFIIAIVGYVLNARNLAELGRDLADSVGSGAIPDYQTISTIPILPAILIVVGIFGAFIILLQNLNKVINAYNNATINQAPQAPFGG